MGKGRQGREAAVFDIPCNSGGGNNMAAYQKLWAAGRHTGLRSSLGVLAVGVLLGALLTFAGLSASQSRALVPWLTGRRAQFSMIKPAALGLLHPTPAMRDLLPWQPLLTDEEVQRAQGYYGTGAAMRRVAGKLLSGEPIKVVTLGGSVTRGLGASRPAHNYANRFFQLINASFPHRGHVFSNKGIGGTSSGIFSACAEQMVPADTDLVVVEFTYNEPEDMPYDSPPRRGFEQLLRKLVKLEGGPAVVLLHHYAWWYTFGDGVEYGLYYRPGESQLQVFANYYDMPAVSMRNALWPLMKAGIEGFKPDKLATGGPMQSPNNITIPGAEPGTQEQFYYWDRTHPSDRGHKMMAEALAGPLMRAVAEEAGARAAGISSSSSRRQDPRLEGVLPPMIPGNEESPTTVCAMQEDFQPMVTKASGFEWRPERPNATSFVEQKWGWTGLNPGDWAELELDTRADPSAGVRVNKDGKVDKANIWLSYLRSYQHMGVALVECKSGCRCGRTTMDATWQDKVSLQQILLFRVSQHEKCRIRVTITDQEGSAPSDGHKITLMAIMVTQFPIRLTVYSSQFEDMQKNLDGTRR